VEFSMECMMPQKWEVQALSTEQRETAGMTPRPSRS
jgi:hypothetical protein